MIVSDANDNVPAFQHGSYATYLSENEPARTTVLQVTASDSDAGRNAKIRSEELIYVKIMEKMRKIRRKYFFSENTTLFYFNSILITCVILDNNLRQNVLFQI